MQDLLPAGWLAFAGRELNPLDRYERFPSCYISSPFPEFILTLGSLEFGDALEYAAADLLAGDFGEQPLDQVDPGRRCWCEVQLEARMLGEPSLHLLGLVGLVVVADRMHVEVLGYGPVDLFQETDEFLGAVAWQNSPMTSPVFTSSAANNVVVPLRL